MASRNRGAAPARVARGSSNGSAPGSPRPVGVLGRERVSEIQRARIVTAMTELVRERGVAAITVAHVVGRSGVSRRTFYELFSDREDCLLEAFEHAVGRAAAVVLPAYEAAGVESQPAAGARGAGAGGGWEARIRAGLGALLGFLDEEPAIGGLLVVDALAAERPVLERRARVVQALIDAVHQGGARPRGGPGRRPARIVAEGAVGAVLAVVHARLSTRDPKPLAGLLNQLMGMIVLPYRGAEAAERELQRSAPRPRRRPAAPADPLRELDMRLTYRTMRVLLAIAERSGASSREVADASGVTDQGQMSKLLWRLEHLGLISNGAERHSRGEPNAWSLTPKGQQVQRAIHAQTGR
jgi:AcrR family transcriptional regulator/DNA-binding MarR family transcriptional regulator